jgi:hypothetical protein
MDVRRREGVAWKFFLMTFLCFSDFTADDIQKARQSTSSFVRGVLDGTFVFREHEGDRCIVEYRFSIDDGCFVWYGVSCRDVE